MPAGLPEVSNTTVSRTKALDDRLSSVIQSLEILKS